jgi:hypothetical protein
LLAIDNIKSTGADKLDPGLLKCAAPIIVGSITHIFYLTLLSGNIPNVRKSVIVPIRAGVVVMLIHVTPFQGFLT